VSEQASDVGHTRDVGHTSEGGQTSDGAAAALAAEIDRLDDEIVGLLARRLALARRRGLAEGGGAGAAAYAPAREAELLDRLVRDHGASVPPEHLRAIYREVLSATRSLLAPPRVAFLGPRATYGHQAALQKFGAGAVYLPAPTNPEIVGEVERGNADFGVLPIENSTMGPVLESQDRLVETTLQVCDEVTIPIAHTLLARCSMDEVRTVYSHPQASGQCARWLAQHLPGRAIVAVASTALAAERAAAEPNAASISPRLAADEFGLDVLATNIQDLAHNYTRFWVLGRRMSERPTGSDKTAVVFSIRDRVGTLRDVTQAFAERGISLSAIQSRPSKRAAWDYLFFFELRGHAAEPVVQDALAAIEQHTVFLKVLGSWPVAAAE
jgi:chorismate mutase / prephenate dehydratase